MCDLAVACVCANSEHLIAKLHFYGIRVVAEEWFRSWLTGRRQNGEVKSPNSAQNRFSGVH